LRPLQIAANSIIFTDILPATDGRRPAEQHRRPDNWHSKTYSMQPCGNQQKGRQIITIMYMSYGKKNWSWFAKTELLSVCVRPSVLPSAFISAAPAGRLFVKFDTGEAFTKKKSVQKSKNFVKIVGVENWT
jgi:hypothetical protein